LDSQRSTDGSRYRLDLERAIEVVKEMGICKVGLQVPEGLKRSAHSIARLIREQTSAEVIVSGEPCYGACDLDLALAREVDLLIHVGHARLLDEPMNVLYLEARMVGKRLRESLAQAIPLLESRRIGVVTTVQHVHLLDDALDALSKAGIEGVIGPAGRRTPYPGQVLGCSFQAARSLDVPEFIFIGTGMFHPIGVALSTGKSVVALDPITGEATIVDPSPLIRRRFGSIARAGNARRFAVIASKKPGQRRMDLCERMMELGRSHGKEMMLVYVDRVDPDVLINLGVEAAVSTACPRIALDDAARYNVPLLTPPEFELLLKEREEYKLDEIE